MGVSCVAALGQFFDCGTSYNLQFWVFENFQNQRYPGFGFLKVISEQNDHHFPDFEILQTTGKELAFQCRFFDQFFNLFS